MYILVHFDRKQELMTESVFFGGGRWVMQTFLIICFVYIPQVVLGFSGKEVQPPMQSSHGLTTQNG